GLFLRYAKPRARGPGFDVGPSTGAPKERKMLAHRDAHAAEIEGGLKTDLPSAQFHDDAVLVPQACCSGATGNRKTSSDCRVCTDDVRRAPKVGRTADEIGAGRSKGADAQSADA